MVKMKIRSERRKQSIEKNNRGEKREREKIQGGGERGKDETFPAPLYAMHNSTCDNTFDIERDTLHRKYGMTYM